VVDRMVLAHRRHGGGYQAAEVDVIHRGPPREDCLEWLTLSVRSDVSTL
jgi:hypothetical protein